MKTDDSSTRFWLRRSQDGAVLVVVLLAMIGLLGMGLTGLYLTSGNIQMSSNINMRNQALYVAEAGLQTAKGILNRIVVGFPNWQPDLNGMLAGIHSPAGVVVATPSGYTDEIPGRLGTYSNDPGCLGTSTSNNVTDPVVPTRGAYLRDEDPPPSGFGCQPNASTTPQPVYIDCNYPPKYSGTTLAYNEAPTDPNAMSPAPTQYMGKYTLFIRQDLPECRLGSFTSDLNGIVVIRSEGTASDNRTKVVLEATMSTNPNTQLLTQGIATVCPAGAAGCDDNSSVQQGITVGPPGAGGAGGSGGGGTGGTTSACSKNSDCSPPYCCNGSCVTSTQYEQEGCLGGCGASCPANQPTCCNGKCQATDNTNTNAECGACGNSCPSSTPSCCPVSSGNTLHTCTNTNIDNNNCGGCNVKCTSPQACCAGRCVDTTTDSNNCGQCGNTCSAGVSCCASQCCGSPKICCVDECMPDPGCPTVTAIGIYGPWDPTASKTNSGTSAFNTWLKKQAKGCTLGGPEDTPLPGTLSHYLPSSKSQQVIILLDVAHDQKDLTNLLTAGTSAYWYHSVGTSGYTGKPMYGDMTGPLTVGDAQALGQWVLSGGGLMTTLGISCDGNEATFPNELLGWITNNDPNHPTISYVQCVVPKRTRFGGAWVSPNGPGFKTTAPIASVITNGVELLEVQGTYSLNAPSNDSAALSSYAYVQDTTVKGEPIYRVGVAGVFGSGRLNVWGDEWITYNDVWNDVSAEYQAAQYWGNVIRWLGQCPSSDAGSSP